ncbi:MAG: hypothetical protein EYC68_16865 [Chloroflexota bacterium]|nr:MAG: hypothetical protein EYC68_16865 [Chloroflexota bacterium]
MPRFELSWRKALVGLILVIAFVVLGIELATLGQQWIASPLIDYDVYVQRGVAARQGIFFPAEKENPYPLPTTLFVFIPLSFLPPWFKIIWTLGPYLILLFLFGRAGILWWLYYPMMIQGATGQMDGWLWIPLLWLFENRPGWAGIGAVLLLFKPQLAWLTVLVGLIFWIARRDRVNLFAFTIAFLILWMPSFIIRPLWPLEVIAPILQRANESILPTRGATLWGWVWWYGGWLVWFVPLLLALMGFLAYRVVRAKPLQTAQCIDLLITPVLYPSNMVMLVPILKKPREILILVAASWFAVALDGIFNVFGGAYVILPLTTLWLLSNPKIVQTLGKATATTTTSPPG